MSLKACPKCGANSVFVPLAPAVGYDGTLYGSKSEGFCNNPHCDQRFWYYPPSGRITRRNIGNTYREWRLRQVDVAVVNAMRRGEGLLPLVEPTGIEPLLVESVPESFDVVYDEIGEDGPEEILGERSLYRWCNRAWAAMKGWWYLYLAAIMSPFRKD